MTDLTPLTPAELSDLKAKAKAAQVEQIEDAPEGALIRLSFGVGEAGTTVTVIEEG